MKHRRAALALILASAGTAHADDGVKFTYNGFGTVGAVKTNTDDAEYRSSLRQEKGADTSADIGVVSRLGLQGNVQFSPMFSAVGQIIVSRRDGHEGPQLEWLFGQARLAPWVDLRVGRMVLPAFMVSDTRNVGFASHWIHAPHEVYDTYPPTAFDGAQAVFRKEWGGVNFVVQPSYGQTESGLFYLLPGKSELKYKNFAGINLSAEMGNWKVRYGLVDGHNPQFVNDNLPAPLAAAGNHDKFTGFGVQYDDGALLVMAEYITRRQSLGIFDSKGGYATAGYRFGAWMPYIVYSEVKPEGPAYLSNAKDSTRSAGLRWDVIENVAIKYQFESSTPGFQFTKGSPTFEAENKRVSVHSLAVDFVF
jgi:hypothetical protein